MLRVDANPPELAVVLGSGWAGAATAIGRPVREASFDRLPGFSEVSVPGQRGLARIVETPGGLRVLLLLGRIHLYDGRGAHSCAHPVRTASALGCRTVILTNGAGSLNPSLRPGDVAVIIDHINLTGASPLTGPQFVDLTDAYSVRLRGVARDVDPTVAEGVYAQFRGPQFETPAEVRMAGGMGADLVGMSTAVETIAARAEGMEVLGLSLVTNAAAGITPGPISHEHVLAAGEGAGERLGRLLSGVIELA